MIQRYCDALVRSGETVTFRRYSGTGDARTSVDRNALARVMDMKPEEIAGNIQEGSRKLIVLARDVDAANWSPALRKGDRVVVRGKELTIDVVDDNTRRVAGVLIAYELVARG